MFFLGSCLPVTEYSGILTSLHFFPTWVLFKAVLWGSGNSSGEGNGNPLQYSCLENPKDRGAWQAAVRGITRIGHLYLLYLNSLLCWHCPPPGDLPNPGIETRSPALQADSLLSELSGKPIISMVLSQFESLFFYFSMT